MTENSGAVTEADPLGLKFQSVSLERPPAICLYGPSGAGKTRELARAFPRCKWVVTSDTILRPHKSWVENNKEAAAEIGLSSDDPVLLYPTVIPKEHPITGEPVDPRPALRKIMQALIKDAHSGNPFYDGLVIDEWSEMSQRIAEGVKNDSTYGKDGFKRAAAVKDFHYEVANFSKRSGKVLGLVCHEREPTFDGKEGSPTQGQMLHRGGPAMAHAKLTHEVSAALDIVLRIRVTDELDGTAKRRYDTSISEKWISKIRADGIDQQVPLGLRELLIKAGYVL